MRKASTNKASLTRKANAAMRDAVAKVVEDHRQRHMPLAIWQDGRVVRIEPDQVCPDSEIGASLVCEKRATYKTRRSRSR